MLLPQISLICVPIVVNMKCASLDMGAFAGAGEASAVPFKTGHFERKLVYFPIETTPAPFKGGKPVYTFS